jgi:putative hydrolases of HD superfamily
MTTDLHALFEFIRFSAALRNVTRGNNATPHRKESVAEHSWHLALIAWTLHQAFEDEFQVSIAQERVIKMCLLHDLVEIAVGDVSAWDSPGRAAIAVEEDAAAQAIFARLPAPLGDEMLRLWQEFEHGDTLEAKIARGIDRVNPALMRLLTEQGWSDVNADVAKLDSLQLPRLDFSTTLRTLYDSIKTEAVDKGLLKP